MVPSWLGLRPARRVRSDVQHPDTSSFADNSIVKEGTPPGLPPTGSAQAVGMPESLEILGLAPGAPAMAHVECLADPCLRVESST